MVGSRRTQSNRQSSRFRLEDHLILARFIASKLGINKLSEIREFKDVREGFDSDGRSYMFHAILTRPSNTISEDKLKEYDDNIRRYFENWKRRRKSNITLKYYQYLALLFTEIFLDKYFTSPSRFLNEINEWVLTEANNRGSNITEDDVFGSINKIAYWMATGSGKTMIMNINYWQFMHYNKGQHKIDYENIILITPSDEMSDQHLRELKTSGIPAILFQGNTSGYFAAEDKDTIKVISIHKLKLPEDKKGEGVTIDVSSLGSRNLVFVDEGHKGQTSEDMKWKQIRDYLVKDKGFTFEYSATFGQVISGQDGAYKEYSKAILFDYSYKYFFSDGYGKDFRILNVKKFEDKDVRIIQLANLISFYEQLLLYEEYPNIIKEYNIEKPLWIFVGSRVNESESDVLEVVRFLNWFLTEDGSTIKSYMQKILDGNTGIMDKEDKDVFAPRYPEVNFPYLRGLIKNGSTSKEIVNNIYDDILKRVFHTSSSASRRLHLINLKKAEGEIMLKAGSSDKYFGVINIGNKDEFIKLVERGNQNNIRIENDVNEMSLFSQINEPNTSLNILIGAKKFLEGWDSWRVSSMCLLNIGKHEGPQIIQLFGRGVRLKGKGYCLKRSRFVEGTPPKELEPLETLNIYGIKANYLETFREVIEKEDVQRQEITLKTQIICPFPQDLKILKPKEEKSFTEEIFILKPRDDIEAKVDLLPRASVIDAKEEQILNTPRSDIQPKRIDNKLLNILDWDEILLEILQYKKEKGYHNFIVMKENLKEIIYQHKYQLFCTDTYLQNTNEPFSETYKRIRDLVIIILKKYFERFYITERNAWEKKRYGIDTLHEDDDNILKEYKLTITDNNLVNQISNLIESRQIYRSRNSILANAYFNNHLYQPLLTQENDKITITPKESGLNKNEKKFVEDLNDYLKNKEELKCYQFYLLRNLTRSKGVGFFETNTFYPDFILWMIKDDQQKIIFIDPKGLMYIDSLDHPKLNLHKYLNEIEKELNNKVKLDAFIISTTPYEQIKNRYGNIDRNTLEEENHILFQYESKGKQNSDYICRMFELISIDA
jgi:hypothetical protein